MHSATQSFPSKTTIQLLLAAADALIDHNLPIAYDSYLHAIEFDEANALKGIQKIAEKYMATKCYSQAAQCYIILLNHQYDALSQLENCATQLLAGTDTQRTQEVYDKFIHFSLQLKKPLEKSTYFNLATLTQDPSKKAEYYTQAANAGHVEAQYQLATLFKNGTGIEKDEKQSHHWLNQAENNNHKSALIELANFYSNLAENGNSLAIDKLEAYANKLIKLQEYNLAVTCLIHCIKQLSHPAMFTLTALAHDKKISEAQYISTIENAIQQHDAYAMNLMGDWYWSGREKPDRCAITAFQYYLRAAEGGSELAMRSLGCIYELGILDVPKDMIKALDYCTAAAPAVTDMEKTISNAAKNNIYSLFSSGYFSNLWEKELNPIKSSYLEACAVNSPHSQSTYSLLTKASESNNDYEVGLACLKMADIIAYADEKNYPTVIAHSITAHKKLSTAAIPLRQMAINQLKKLEKKSEQDNPALTVALAQCYEREAATYLPDSKILAKKYLELAITYYKKTINSDEKNTLTHKKSLHNLQHQLVFLLTDHFHNAKAGALILNQLITEKHLPSRAIFLKTQLHSPTFCKIDSLLTLLTETIEDATQQKNIEILCSLAQALFHVKKLATPATTALLEKIFRALATLEIPAEFSFSYELLTKASAEPALSAFYPDLQLHNVANSVFSAQDNCDHYLKIKALISQSTNPVKANALLFKIEEKLIEDLDAKKINPTKLTKDIKLFRKEIIKRHADKNQLWALKKYFAFLLAEKKPHNATLIACKIGLLTAPENTDHQEMQKYLNKHQSKNCKATAQYLLDVVKNKASVLNLAGGNLDKAMLYHLNQYAVTRATLIEIEKSLEHHMVEEGVPFAQLLMQTKSYSSLANSLQLAQALPLDQKPAPLAAKVNLATAAHSSSTPAMQSSQTTPLATPTSEAKATPALYPKLAPLSPTTTYTYETPKQNLVPLAVSAADEPTTPHYNPNFFPIAATESDAEFIKSLSIRLAKLDTPATPTPNKTPPPNKKPLILA